MIRHRRMDVADLGTALDWAAREGWNPGLDDAAAFHAADPEGFFLAEEDGTPVAAISVVNHSGAMAFLGLYLCRPEHRGRGIGLALWRHALAHAGERSVGLDGVPDQQANYARSGFVRAGETTRWTGAVRPQRDPGVRAVRPGDVPGLIDREAAASGVRKVAYLTAWFTDTATRRTLVLDDGGGFATVRQCRSGAKIGPLVAEDGAAAERLIGHAATLFGPDLTLDVPASSVGLTGVCAGAGFAAGFETARMYRGPAPVAGHPVYAVASLELG